MGEICSKSKVLSWNPSELSSTEKFLAAVMMQLNAAGDGLVREVGGLDWRGEASVAANGRAAEERDSFGRVAAKLGDAKAALSHAREAMSPIVDSLKVSAKSAGGDHAWVDENWVFHDALDYDALYRSCTTQADREWVDRLRAYRQNDLAESTRAARGLASELTDIDAATAGKMRSSMVDLAALAPLSAGLNADDGKRDAESARNGTLTPEQVARMRAASKLANDQARSLAEGKPTRIPAGQFDYMRCEMVGLNGISPDGLLRLGDNLPPQLRDQVQGTLADSVKIMGSPNVQRGGPAYADGGRASGGMWAVPDTMKTVLTGPMSRLSETANQPNYDPRKSVKSIADFLAKGNLSLATGSDVDRALIHDAALIGPPSGYADAPPQPSLASELLHVAAQDHPAVESAFTGSDLNTLMGLNWQGHEQGIRELIDHIGDNAGSSDHLLSDMSGHTARNVAGWVSEHPWTMSEEVTDSVAGVLGKYIPSAVGVPDGVFSTTGFSQMSPDAITNMFSAMDQYKSSAVTFNAAAYGAQGELNYLFGLHGGATQYSDLAMFAGRIDHFATTGMDNYMDHANLADVSGAHGRSDYSEAVFDSIKDGGLDAAELVPQLAKSVPGVGLAVDVGAPFLKEMMLNSTPDNPVTMANPTAPVSSSGTEARQFYSVMQGLHDAHSIPPDSPLMKYFGADGKLLPFERMGPTSQMSVEFRAAVKSMPGFDMESYDGEMRAGESGKMDDH